MIYTIPSVICWCYNWKWGGRNADLNPYFYKPEFLLWQSSQEVTKLPRKIFSAISSCEDIYITKIWMNSIYHVRRCGRGYTSLSLQWYATTSTWANKLSRSSVGKQEPPGCCQSRTCLQGSFVSFSFITAHQGKASFPTSQQSSFTYTRWPSLLFLWSSLIVWLSDYFIFIKVFDREDFSTCAWYSITPRKLGRRRKGARRFLSNVNKQWNPLFCKKQESDPKGTPEPIEINKEFSI